MSKIKLGVYWASNLSKGCKMTLVYDSFLQKNLEIFFGPKKGIEKFKGQD
jgi:hypothetical protein